ncbi:tetratricopeptide repeat protein [Bacteroidota bacterium]
MKYIIFLILLISSFASLPLKAQSSYEIYYLQGDYDKILESTASLADSTDYFWNAVALNAQGEVLESIRILEDGLVKYENDSLQQMLLGDLYFKTGQYAKAKPLLYRFRSDPERFIKLIRVLEFESDNKQAISLLEKQLLKDSLNIEYLSRLGDNYLEIDWILNARESFNKLIRINPGDIVTLGKLANIHLRLIEPETAIMICNKAMAYDSTNRTIIKIRGIAAFRIGDFEHAQSDLSYLIENGDSSIATLKHLGISEYKSYYYKDAEDHLHLAHMKDTSDHEICYFLGKVLVYNEAPEEGLRYLILADSLIQPNPEIRSAILAEQASAYVDLNQNEKGLELYTQAFDESPRPEYLFFIASLYQHRFKNDSKALEMYQVFLDSLPETEREFSPQGKNSQSITLKRTAELNIEKLREELFFNGELGKDSIQD